MSGYDWQWLTKAFLFNSERTSAHALIDYTASLLRSIASLKWKKSSGKKQPLPSLKEFIIVLIHVGRVRFTAFILAMYYLRSIKRLRGIYIYIYINCMFNL